MRPKGSANKNKEFLNKRLRDMYGDDFDPIIKAAQNAVRMESIASNLEGTDDEFNCRKECVNAWDKIAQYVTPKLKAVEVSGNSDAPLNGNWTVEFVNATTEG